MLFIKNLVDLLLTAVRVRRSGICGAMGQGWNMSRVSLAQVISAWSVGVVFYFRYQSSRVIQAGEVYCPDSKTGSANFKSWF